MAVDNELGIRLTIPYLQGTYLALNAISNVYFLGDGPSCIWSKAEQVHARHDIFSTLLNCTGEHRVQYSGINVWNIVGNCESPICDDIRTMSQTPNFGAIFMGSMPMCAIIGTDYERLLKDTLKGKDKAYHVVPRQGAVSGDWIDGYGGILTIMATEMVLDQRAPQPENVAIIGYFMDRNEGEHTGNVKELARMLKALDLRVVSTWLSGCSYQELAKVKNAGTIISLPHCRKAGRILAKRLKIKLIEADLPFGFEATRRFMELIGKELGKEAEARAFIKAELDEVIPMLEWTVPHAFLHRRFAFVTDPHYAYCFKEMMDAVGGEIMGIIITAGTHHLPEDRLKAMKATPMTWFEPLQRDVEDDWGHIPDLCDLWVTNSIVIEHLQPQTPWLEFGFPSEATHILNDEPFLGFQGTLNYYSKMANELIRGLYVNRPMTTPDGQDIIRRKNRHDEELTERKRRKISHILRGEGEGESGGGCCGGGEAKADSSKGGCGCSSGAHEPAAAASTGGGCCSNGAKEPEAAAASSSGGCCSNAAPVAAGAEASAKGGSGNGV